MNIFSQLKKLLERIYLLLLLSFIYLLFITDIVIIITFKDLNKPLGFGQIKIREK